MFKFKGGIGWNRLRTTIERDLWKALLPTDHFGVNHFSITKFYTECAPVPDINLKIKCNIASCAHWQLDFNKKEQIRVQENGEFTIINYKCE
jgi:hypothetical protein